MRSSRRWVDVGGRRHGRTRAAPMVLRSGTEWAATAYRTRHASGSCAWMRRCWAECTRAYAQVARARAEVSGQPRELHRAGRSSERDGVSESRSQRMTKQQQTS
eukprot:5500551-Pleurochrysis_carterae.AAC.1